MGAEHFETPIKKESPARLSAPPGFASLSSFFLKKVEHCEENLGFKASKGASTQEKLQSEAKSYIMDIEKLKESIGNRPWILYGKGDQISKEHQSVQPDKENARQCPGDARTDFLEEAPVFYPSEKEFSDTLKYIESIRLQAEQYGICRIIPPPSWQPPCLLKEKTIWEYSTFVTQIQQFNKFPAQSVKSKTDELYTGTSKRRSSRMSFEQGVSSGYSMDSEEVSYLDMEHSMLVPGPEFTLKTFKIYADCFMQHYFSKHKDMGHHVNCKQGESSVESIEREYRQIVENPTGSLEVLYGDNLDTTTFCSGFPTASNPCELYNYPGYVRSSWNLNNVPKLPGSLLSFESDENSAVLVPQLRIGMCFSSLYWITRLSPFTLRSEGVPVYRCIQYPREFVLVFPGVYHSAFDCGFNVAEAVNFAPLDWLPYGQNTVALYQAQGRKMSISFDKLLIGAAREAVKAQWELSLLGKNTIDNLRWKVSCGKNGILAETLRSRVKQESNRREYLCTTFKKRKDKNFNATRKRECSICYFDLYLSATHCPCSAARYSCLNHAKQLCSCTWTKKILLYGYEMSELNILVEALEGKLSAVYRWAKEDLNLGLRDYMPKENSSTKDEGQKEHRFQDAVTSYGNCWTTASSVKEEIKARLRQSQYLNEQKSKEKTVSTPLLPSVTQDDTKLLLREMMSEASSSSKTVSSSSDSDTSDLDLSDEGKEHIMSKSSSRPPRHPEREVTQSGLRRPPEREVSLSKQRRRPKREIMLSELLKDISSKHGKATHFKSTSEGLPMSHPASKKRKKK